MEYRSCEINVRSAKHLNNVNYVSKMDVYVVVSISGDPNAARQKTAVDRDGNTNPSWNFPINFIVDESAARQDRLTLVFKLRCERVLGDKDIGEVNVPIVELLGPAGEEKPQFVTYQVRMPSGKMRGELNFSYKWGDRVTAPPPPPVKADEPMMAYPASAGPSAAYPPPPAAPYPQLTPTGGYPAPTPVAGYSGCPPPYGNPPQPPPPGYGYPPPPPPLGYGYPPPPPGYGYPPVQPGYGYPPVQQPAPKKNNSGLGLGAGLLGGALGGLLIGDMISDDGFF